MIYSLNPLFYILCKITQLLNGVLPILIALGVVYLVWGIVQYMIGDSDEAKQKGRDGIIFGLIGLAVIVSVWGLVYMVVYTFDLDSNNAAPTRTELEGLLPQ